MIHKNRLILFTLPLFLCSCSFGIKRKNAIIDGFFDNFHHEDEIDKYCLEVKSITKEEFLSLNGINVIEDLVDGGFYTLDFYKVDENRKRLETYEFKNFKDDNLGVDGKPIKAQPIHYKDEYGTILYPNTHGTWPIGYTFSYRNEFDVSVCNLDK